MTRTALAALAFAAVALPSIPALAQAPGAGVTPAPAPTIVVVSHPKPRKIGVSLRMSALGMHPEENPEAHSDFGGGGLAISYRIARRWGLELAADHFTEQESEDMPLAGEPRELQAVSISATFHLRGRARWDAYLIAGLNAATVVDANGEDGVGYGGGHLGIGLERRFRRLGLSAELRMLGMSETPEQGEETQPAYATTMDPAENEAAALSGGQVSLAATYYF